jgi:hypothetical protein
LHFLQHTKIVVPFSLGRSIRGLSFNENILFDPFGKMCKDLLHGVDREIVVNELFSKYTQEQKKYSAADIVYLKNNLKLKQFPAWSLVLPWNKISIEKKFKTYPDKFYLNRSKHNLTLENSSTVSIVKALYSLESAESQISQTEALLISIKKYGLKNNNDCPKFNILVKDGEWRWIMDDAGNHRAYILSLLDFEYFEGVVSSVIYKNKAASWENVKNGTYSIEEAESIFDACFDGLKPIRGIV